MSDSVEKQLYFAAGYNRASEVSSILRDNPNFNVNQAHDENKWTSLHNASLNGHVEVVKLLLAHPNIDVNLKCSNGQTPFSFGCEEGQVSVVEVLLKDPRVNVILDDDNGCPPQWSAAYPGRLAVIEWLIASGRDLGDIKNKKGKDPDGSEYSALEIARRENKTEVVSELERFIANPEQTRQEIRRKLNVTGKTSFSFPFLVCTQFDFVSFFIFTAVTYPTLQFDAPVVDPPCESPRGHQVEAGCSQRQS